MKGVVHTGKVEGFDLSFGERGTKFEDEQRQHRSRDDGEQCEKQKRIATEKSLKTFQLKKRGVADGRRKNWQMIVRKFGVVDS